MEAAIRKLKEASAEMLSLKKQSSNNKDLKDEAEHRGHVALLELRQAIRDASRDAAASREAADAARASLEATYDEWLTVTAERLWLNREDGDLMDELDLMPESEFWETASEDLKAKARKGIYEKIISRIEHEIEVRKKLSREVEELSESKKAKEAALRREQNASQAVKAVLLDLKNKLVSSKIAE